MEVLKIREFIGNLSWIFYSPPQWKAVHKGADFCGNPTYVPQWGEIGRMKHLQRKDVN